MLRQRSRSPGGRRRRAHENGTRLHLAARQAEKPSADYHMSERRCAKRSGVADRMRHDQVKADAGRFLALA